MRRLVLACLLALVALPAASAGAADRRVPTGWTGMVIEGPALDGTLPLDAQLRRIAGTGAETLSYQLSWAALQPNPFAAPDFSKLDPLVLAAARAGLRQVPIVLRAPSWGGTDPGNAGSPPKPEPFAAFMGQVVERYGSRGSLWRENPDVRELPITTWQIWNEPTIDGFWSKPGWPAGVAAMMRAVAPAIRRADPKARIVLPALVRDSWVQLETLYRRGIRRTFDVVGLHPYTRRIEDTEEILRRNRAVMRRFGDARKPLALGELSYPSSVGRIPSVYGYETTERGQATKLRALFERLASKRRTYRIESALWFSWASYHRDRSVPFDYSGLLEVESDGRTRAKPALAAWTRVARSLTGRR